MKRPSQQLDQHGFPVPPKFDHDQPVDVRRHGLGGRRWGRLVVGILLLATFAAMMGLAADSPWGAQMRMAWVEYLCQRAQSKYDADDLPGALAEMDRAITWLPDSAPLVAARIHEFRGQMRIEARDLQGALDDGNRAVSLVPAYDEQYSSELAAAHMFRGMVSQHLKEHRKAIDDFNQAVASRQPQDPNPFNMRAYARALAGVELNDALDDVQKAIKFSRGEIPAYIDTRGYLHYLLGNYNEALVDMDRAIELTEQEQARKLAEPLQHSMSKGRLDRLRRQYQEMLAVMYHHRGEIYQKLDRPEDAARDLKLGNELGYNPDKGVF